MLRAEMEKIKLEVKPGRGAADVGEEGGFWCCSMVTLMGCSRSGVLAPSTVFWGLSQCQDLTLDGDGVEACVTCPLLSRPAVSSRDRVAAGTEGRAFLCISQLLCPNQSRAPG